eukprot:31302-Pelagococcus_subviridis.AAC.18
MQRVDALILRPGDVQRHVAQHPVRGVRGAGDGREGQVAALRRRAHLEVVDVVHAARAVARAAPQRRDAPDALNRRLEERDVTFEHADDVRIREQVDHLETRLEVALVHLHLVDVIGFAASGQRRGDAALAADAEVALLIRDAHRDRESSRGSDGHRVEGTAREHPHGERAGAPPGGAFHLHELPRRVLQRPLARLHERAEAAGAQESRPRAHTATGGHRADDRAGRRRERLLFLQPATLPRRALQPPLRLAVLQPSGVVDALVRGVPERLERFSRDVHRVGRPTALADDRGPGD